MPAEMKGKVPNKNLFTKRLDLREQKRNKQKKGNEDL